MAKLALELTSPSSSSTAPSTAADCLQCFVVASQIYEHPLWGHPADTQGSLSGAAFPVVVGPCFAAICDALSLLASRIARGPVQQGRSTEKGSEGTLVPMVLRRTLTFPHLNVQVHVLGCCSCPRCASTEAPELSSEVSQVPAHSLAPHSRGQGPCSPSKPAQGEVLVGPGPLHSQRENESRFIPWPLHSSHYDKRAPP